MLPNITNSKKVYKICSHSLVVIMLIIILSGAGSVCLHQSVNVIYQERMILLVTSLIVI